jgi:hypothetical protein
MDVTDFLFSKSKHFFCEQLQVTFYFQYLLKNTQFRNPGQAAHILFYQFNSCQHCFITSKPAVTKLVTYLALITTLVYSQPQSDAIFWLQQSVWPISAYSASWNRKWLPVTCWLHKMLKLLLDQPIISCLLLWIASFTIWITVWCATRIRSRATPVQILH